MNCCCATAGTNEFFNTQARRLEKYFRKKGLRPEQKLLMAGIQLSGVQRASLLEIGCGVGGLHLSLLKTGAGRATGFDLSEKMIQTARMLAHELGYAERTQYWQGDFVEMHESAETAEVTILDKVICCYGNFLELVELSAAKTSRIYAVSYPRRHWGARLFFRAAIVSLKLLRQSFHPYYHPPEAVQAAIQQQGFSKIFERNTFIWTVQIFQRDQA